MLEWAVHLRPSCPPHLQACAAAALAAGLHVGHPFCLLRKTGSACCCVRRPLMLMEGPFLQGCASRSILRVASAQEQLGSWQGYCEVWPNCCAWETGGPYTGGQPLAIACKPQERTGKQGCEVWARQCFYRGTASDQNGTSSCAANNKAGSELRIKLACCNMHVCP